MIFYHFVVHQIFGQANQQGVLISCWKSAFIRIVFWNIIILWQ